MLLFHSRLIIYSLSMITKKKKNPEEISEADSVAESL